MAMVFIGADHHGVEQKGMLCSFFDAEGIAYQDFGTNANGRVDFTDHAFPVAEAVAKDPENQEHWGILLCGSGNGVAIAANKVQGVRAIIALNPEMATQGREHDEANILVIASDFVQDNEVVALVQAFMNAPYGGEERHRRRMNAIREYEKTM